MFQETVTLTKITPVKHLSAPDFPHVLPLSFEWKNKDILWTGIHTNIRYRAVCYRWEHLRVLFKLLLLFSLVNIFIIILVFAIFSQNKLFSIFVLKTEVLLQKVNISNLSLHTLCWHIFRQRLYKTRSRTSSTTFSHISTFY